MMTMKVRLASLYQVSPAHTHTLCVCVATIHVAHILHMLMMLQKEKITNFYHVCCGSPAWKFSLNGNQIEQTCKLTGGEKGDELVVFSRHDIISERRTVKEGL